MKKVEWKKFDWNMGLRGAVAVAVGTAIGHVVGIDPAITGLSAAFVTLTDPPGHLKDKLRVMGIWTLVGTLLTIVGLMVGDYMWPMTISLTVVTFFCGLTLFYGPNAAMLGLLMNCWFVVVLELSGPPVLDKLAGFLIGGLVAMIAITVFTFILIPYRKKRGTSSAPKGESGPNIRSIWRSPAFQFAVVKACAVGAAAILGWMLVGAKPFWVVFAPLSIVKPDLHQTKLSGLKRIAGTIVGGIVGVLLIGNLQDPLVLLTMVILIIFLFLSVVNLSYTIEIMLLTILMIVVGRIEGASAIFSGAERIVATILGVVIAFVVILMIKRMEDSRKAHLG
jgi:hypothetical protein